jgi:hypothetical protein
MIQEEKCDLCDCSFTDENPKRKESGYTLAKHLGYALHAQCYNKWIDFWKANSFFSALEAFEIFGFIYNQEREKNEKEHS